MRSLLWWLFFPFLWILSLLYASAQAFRRALYEKGALSSVRFPCKVISVGNTLVGGTGKTPVVIELAKFLGEKTKVAILTRGYKSGLKPSEGVVLLGGEPKLYIDLRIHDDWQLFNADRQQRPTADEAFLQSHHLPEVPTVVGAKRSKLMQKFLKQKLIPSTGGDSRDCIILDDGLQHLKIKRDVDICLGHADLEWMKARVMPIGRLREHNHVLSKVDYILLTKAKEATAAQAWLQSPSLLGGLSHIEATTLHKAVYGKSGLGPVEADPKVAFVLVSAIAMPESFERTVLDLGFRVHHHEKYSDHAVLSAESLSSLKQYGLPVLTTEKDYYRHPDLFCDVFGSVFVLPIRVTIPSSLKQLLEQKVLRG